ncbi:peptidase S9 prolyl oligopeptidase active site domain protein [Gluconacetobacter diazotrophicus PA1 5]|uniref:Putative peptidase n=1 Tax=Gluconacetobacter diazotrophicus (strain ATCC 49037 / DSM 5601 / CCUG 37298 / CIP 103539 / LMG 7603 / PAl5) TaxID=272568 RepID=A9HE30_GLUDA|nr:prolyl oligopeptidase family serine peptidase [Gluconacetobacter diazotrophicus]ACI51705.1 peptidase S9 prolyl oligopeptidase active site domain protein [Gluconacetobacter diazotrophicus PA1 5]TWB11049.1 dipeptidyl aminopeptidase/acylaminoacyl peptidase [Gluconacetobacter diazotrophicus]CAP55177.1 putative peptidase [Gluconacetobacter diazotrophicus PA1 5]
MTDPTVAKGASVLTQPFGTWPSAVTTALVAGRTVGLSAVQADGDAILWLETRPSEAGRTVLVRWTAGTGAVDLTPPPLDVGTRVHEYGGGAYAVSGGRIAFSHRPDGSVWVIEADGPARAISTVAGLRFADFTFDPAGARLFCVREDHRAGGEPVSALVALPLAGGDPATQAGQVLVSGPDFVSSPRPSPDGAHLAWIEWNHPAMPWDATRLRVGRLERDGTLAGARTLAGDGDPESVIEPAWAGPRALYAASDRSGWWNLWRFTLPGGGPEPVAPMAAEIGLPHWVFGQCSYRPLPDGSILAIAIDHGEARTIRIKDDPDPSMRVHAVAFGHPAQCPAPLADGSLAWIDTPPDGPPAVVHGRVGAPPDTLRAAAVLDLAPGDIARAETIRFPLPDAPGGVQRGHAFFYPPASSRFRGPADEKPPLIVMAHGGPTGRASEAFSFKVQWWTSRGFAVVDVNYGGSTGFGRAYRRRLEGKWGEIDVADCIAACRFLIEHGRVDPHRIAIRGSSAGGLTVLLALARSSLFAAGASLYGVTDLRALAQETHKFESRYLDSLVGPYPAAEATYLARSPLTQATGIQVPVLFLHGLDDAVVPPGQARAMATALSGNAVPHAHYEFPGESHGFRREATIRRALDLELDFYGQVFGFTVPDVSERVVMRS